MEDECCKFTGDVFAITRHRLDSFAKISKSKQDHSNKWHFNVIVSWTNCPSNSLILLDDVCKSNVTVLCICYLCMLSSHYFKLYFQLHIAKKSLHNCLQDNIEVFCVVLFIVLLLLLCFLAILLQSSSLCLLSPPSQTHGFLLTEIVIMSLLLLTLRSWDSTWWLQLFMRQSCRLKPTSLMSFVFRTLFCGTSMSGEGDTMLFISGCNSEKSK